MKPINDRVVVKPALAEERTKGGIIIPDTAKEKPQRGRRCQDDRQKGRYCTVRKVFRPRIAL